MNRLVVILLCLFSVVACAVLAYLGYQQQLESAKVKDSPPPIRCTELLEQVPAGLQGLTLTEFKPGKHFVTDDKDDDGEWERVLVPVFPANIKKLEKNYRAIILIIADAPNKTALFEKIESEGLVAEYWYTAQELDPANYSRLAEHYTSMDFSRSILLYSGFPKSDNAGTYLFWGASAGGLLSILVLGWQSLSLILAGFKNETRRVARSESVMDDIPNNINRAGLPTDLDEL